MHWNGLSNLVWEQEVVPDEWLDASITPVHKSGSRIRLGNYRPIALMSVVAKPDRLTKYLEEEQKIVEEQGGFRVNRGCVDQIFILNEVIVEEKEERRHT